MDLPQIPVLANHSDKPPIRRESKLIDCPFANRPPIERIPRRLRFAREHCKPLSLFEQLICGRSGSAQQVLIIHVNMATGMSHQKLMRCSWNPSQTRDSGFVDETLQKLRCFYETLKKLFTNIMKISLVNVLLLRYRVC